MNIRLSDGRARAARYRLRVESLPRLSSRTEPPPFYLNGGKAFCFDDRELSRAEAWLKDRGIKYEIEKLSAPANWDLTEGVKYSSIEEVRAHLEQDIEPEVWCLPGCVRGWMRQSEGPSRGAQGQPRGAEGRASRGVWRAAEAAYRFWRKTLKVCKGKGGRSNAKRRLCHRRREQNQNKKP